MKTLALRWILDHEAVTTVIPGASNSDQIIENCAASDTAPLSPELHEELREFFQQKVSPQVRGDR